MKKETSSRVVTGVFVGYLGAMTILQFVTADRSFSERENRYLQTIPKFSFSELFQGDFTEDFEDYCADQFPFRDHWITLNARYEQFTGKKETNGVFLCEGERLITPFSAPDASSLRRRVMAVEALREKIRVPLTLALIPDSAELYGELLPKGAPCDSQESLIESIRQMTEIPMADLLTPLRQHKNDGKDLFYRTDHHWTSYGAYFGYQGLCDALGMESIPIERFTPQTVSESFYGTAYSSSGYTWIAPDHMERYVDPTSAVKVVSYQGGEEKEIPLYKEESLTVKDKYTYFLGGNTPRSILYGQDESLPKLLLLRDSYTDSLAPFLLSHFSEIHLLDMRYYLGSPAEYVEENGIDQVVVMYSVSNFCEQNGVLAIAE